MLEKRSVATVVIFSLLTCGIYMVYWTYVTCQALQQQGKKTALPVILTTLMMLFYSSIGGVLLAIDADDNINAIKIAHGMPGADNKILWILLGIFIPIVTVALVQNEINSMIDTAERARAGFEAPTL